MASEYDLLKIKVSSFKKAENSKVVGDVGRKIRKGYQDHKGQGIETASAHPLLVAEVLVFQCRCHNEN